MILFAPLFLAAASLPPSPFDTPAPTSLDIAEKRLRGCVLAGPAQATLLETARAARLRCGHQYDAVLDLRSGTRADDADPRARDARKAEALAMNREIALLLSNATGLAE